MNQRDRCKGRKDSLGKETDVDLYILLPTLNEIYFTLLYFTDALDPDAHFDAIAKLCWGHRYRVVCVGRGRFTLY